MKRFSAIALMLLLVAAFSLPTSVSAAEESGIKPGSFFYGFVTTFEKVNLFFTFNPEKKVEKALRYAEKRLAEAEAVADEENPDAVKTAVAGYERNIALAAEASKKVKDETRAESMLILIADNTSKHQEVLTDVLAKVPDEAKEAIIKAIEASRKGQEEALKQIAELKQEVAELRQEIVELKKQQSIESAPPKNNGAQSQSIGIKELKKEIEDLKKQAAEREEHGKQATPTPKTEAAKTSIVTLPNGAVVEMDANGNILRYIKEALTNIVTPTESSQDVFVSDFKVISSPSTDERNISSVRIEWKTNVPTESKLFLTDSDGEVRIYKSQTGLSTNHFINIGSFEGVTYSYEVEAIGKDDFTKKSGKFTVQERPTPIPTKMRIYSPPYFWDDPRDFSISVSGSKCEAVWFGVAILDQYGNEMANQDVTVITPAGSITKTLTEKDFFMKSYLSTGVQGQRFYYNPPTRDTKESITFTSGNLVATKTLNIRDVVAPYVNYIRDGINQTHIIIRKVEQNDGSFTEEWVLASSGQLIDPETMTCLTKHTALY